LPTNFKTGYEPVPVLTPVIPASWEAELGRIAV
jgi:hypothetical protein